MASIFRSSLTGPLCTLFTLTNESPSQLKLLCQKVHNLALNKTEDVVIDQQSQFAAAPLKTMLSTKEQTLSIIKPDAVSKNVIGQILDRFESKGLKIVAAKMIRLTPKQAKKFYDIHKSKPFFNDLIKFMTSGPILVQVLEGENAVTINREIMGATNPKNAKNGTIRKDFAASIDHNAVHGSDSIENAEKEVPLFFKKNEIHPR